MSVALVDRVEGPLVQSGLTADSLLHFSSGMLPNAVLPPSLDHNYAQWQEREENNRTEQPPLMKKIIPAPKPKGPGEPDSPTPLHPPTPPISSKKTDCSTIGPKPRVLHSKPPSNKERVVLVLYVTEEFWRPL